MDNNSITLETSNRICNHMNKDHKDSLLKYAIEYGEVSNPINIEMLAINSLGMKLNVDGKILQINFDHNLIDSKDAHRTLVEMAKSTNKK